MHKLIVSANAAKKIQDWAKSANIEDKNVAAVLTGSKAIRSGKTVASPDVPDIVADVVSEDVGKAGSVALIASVVSALERAAKPSVEAKLRALCVSLAISNGMPVEEGETAPVVAKEGAAL